MRELARSASLADSAEEAFAPVDGLLPMGAKGKKFHGRGKSPDALGQWLDKALLRASWATTAELWAQVAKTPPRGLVFEADSFGGTIYRRQPWMEVCTRAQWRDRVRRGRERAVRPPAE